MSGTIKGEFERLCTAEKLMYLPPIVPHADLAYAASADSEGICFALSTLFVARYLMNEVVKQIKADTADIFGTQSYDQLVAGFKSNSSLMMILKQVQQYETSRVSAIDFVQAMAQKRQAATTFQQKTAIYNDIMSVYSATSLLAMTCGALSAFNVPPGYKADDLGQGQFPYNGFAQNIAGAEGVYVIKFPTHYVSCVVDPDQRYFAFFDANGGTALTSDRKAFERFLDNFFKGPISKTYSSSSGGSAGLIRIS